MIYKIGLKDSEYPSPDSNGNPTLYSVDCNVYVDRAPRPIQKYV